MGLGPGVCVCVFAWVLRTEPLGTYAWVSVRVCAFVLYNSANGIPSPSTCPLSLPAHQLQHQPESDAMRYNAPLHINGK